MCSHNVFSNYDIAMVATLQNTLMHAGADAGFFIEKVMH